MLTEIFNPLVEFFLSAIGIAGYFGIFLLMTIESSFIPFPSEIVLIPAGALAARGEMGVLFIFIAGVLGSIVGAFINYFIALFLGRTAVDLLLDKYGRFLFLSKENLKKSDMFFNKHGEVTTFIGRLIPIVRQLISLPAGFSKMNLARFSFFTAIGAGIWTLILIYAGYFFGNNLTLIQENLNIITLLLLLFSAIVVVSYILIKRKKCS